MPTLRQKIVSTLTRRYPFLSGCGTIANSSLIRMAAGNCGGSADDVGAALAQLPPSQFPLTVDVAGEMGAYGSDDHYDFVLDHLVGGLRATADAEPMQRGEP